MDENSRPRAAGWPPHALKGAGLVREFWLAGGKLKRRRGRSRYKPEGQIKSVYIVVPSVF